MITPPYTVEARPDTGLYNAKLGMWLFLAAELMFYGALLSSYVFLRTAGQAWPAGADVLPLKLAALNGLVLTLVCIAVSRSWAGFYGEVAGRPWAGLGIAVTLGAVSALLITLEHGLLLRGGASPATSTFYGIYFVMTGVQWLHVVCATLYAAYLLGPGRGLYAADPIRFRNRLECAGLFWHFLAFMWLGILVLFYLV